MDSDEIDLKTLKSIYALSMAKRFRAFKRSAGSAQCKISTAAFLGGFAANQLYHESYLMGAFLLSGTLIWGKEAASALMNARMYSGEFSNVCIPEVNKYLKIRGVRTLKLGCLSSTHAKRLAMLAATMVLAASIAGGFSWDISERGHSMAYPAQKTKILEWHALPN